MKQALRNLAAVLFILMLIVSSASCMDIASHSQPPCSHCTKHLPPNQQAPVCCDAHHQPSAAAVTINLEQPIQSSTADTAVIHLDALGILSPREQLIWPPPLRPRVPLRI